MQRVNRSTAVPTMPAPPSGGTPGYFTGGNPSAGQGATVPGYEWFNAVQEEIMAVILRGGITPDPADPSQMRKSMDRQYAGAYRDIASNTTLTPDDSGLVRINASAGPLVITLPNISAFANRVMRFAFFRIDGSPNTVTVVASSGNFIEFASAITIPPLNFAVGCVLEIWSDGSNQWFSPRPLPAASDKSGVMRIATAAEIDAGTNPDVAVTPFGLGGTSRSFAANGYLRIPGAGMIQWGAGQTTASPPTTFNFPIAFPAACLRVVAVSEGNGASPMGVEILSNSQFRAWGRDVVLTGAPYSSRSFAYLAIGH